MIFNSAIHDLDVVPWLLGSPITEVSWHAPGAPSSTAGGLHDPFLLLLRTADGALSIVENSLNARYGYDMRSEVLCETGVVAIVEPRRTVTSSALGASTRLSEDFRPRFAEAYRLELQEWVTALAEGRAPKLATIDDGAQATRVAAAAVQSMRSGGVFVRVADPVSPTEAAGSGVPVESVVPIGVPVPASVAVARQEGE